MSEEQKIEATPKEEAIADTQRPEEQAPAAPKLPRGVPRETEKAAARPGEIVQVYVKFPSKVRLEGFILVDGFEVTKVFLGKDRFPGDDGKGAWSDVFGREVTPEQILIVLAKNTTQKPLVAYGVWYVQGEGLEPAVSPAPVANLHAPVAPPAANPAAPSVGPFGPPVTTYVAQPAQPQVIPVPSGGIRLGTNEVAVLLTREDVKRLRESITGGTPIMDNEKANLIRRLDGAIG